MPGSWDNKDFSNTEIGGAKNELIAKLIYLPGEGTVAACLRFRRGAGAKQLQLASVVYPVFPACLLQANQTKRNRFTEGGGVPNQIFGKHFRRRVDVYISNSPNLPFLLYNVSFLLVSRKPDLY